MTIERNHCQRCQRAFTGDRWSRYLAKHEKRCQQQETNDPLLSERESDQEDFFELSAEAGLQDQFNFYSHDSIRPDSVDEPTSLTADENPIRLDNEINETESVSSDISYGSEFSEDQVSEELDDLDIDSDLDIPNTSHYFAPFPDKTFAIMFVLLFGKRRRLSIEQMALVWGLFELLEIPCPRLHQLLSMRKKICRVPPEERISTSGISIHVRPIPRLITEVFGNPSIAKEIRTSPQHDENPNSTQSELYESLAFAVRAPVLFLDWNTTRLYAGDLIQHGNNQGVILCFPKPGFCSIGKSVETFRPNILSNFTCVFCLQTGTDVVIIQRGPLSLKADGLDVINFPVACSSDETSGNISKRYNKFENFFVIFPALPHQFHGSKHINFVATTNEGDWKDIADVSLKDLQFGSELANGMRVFNAFTKKHVLVVSSLLLMLVDNPRASNICQHVGAEGSFYCRCCLAEKGTFLNEQSRTLAQTRDALNRMQDAPSNAEIGRIRKETGVVAPDGRPNIYLELPAFFPSAQTPTEILHTGPLGWIKYLALECKKLFSSADSKPRVASLFSIVARYPGVLSPKQVTHYIGSMVGKDMKQLSEIGPFFFCWVKPEFRWIWAATSLLVKLVYTVKYNSRIQHYNLLQRASMVTLCLFQKEFPATTSKYKIHRLCHVADDFFVWGPLPRIAVEVPEQMNGDSRKYIANSNRHWPSRDVAWDFSVRESLLSLLSGHDACSPGMKELGSNPLVKKLLRLLITDSEPSVKCEVGSFYFFNDWKQVGMVVHLREDIRKVEFKELVLMGRNTSWGIPARGLAHRRNTLIRIDHVNGLADVFHDCWEPHSECLWQADGDITHQRRNQYILNPFRMDHHHDLSVEETNVFLDFLQNI
ncbi:hypothetical protein BDR26DRAFT_964463 [Obelidium mucronatum]|nr:hypothetical protein BDR26DRAFT_964463 [Obelidium mucronatum]